jgi:putative transposase
MPRLHRHLQAGEICHIMNRGGARQTIFHKPEDYEAFIRILREGMILEPLSILEYCLMPNHWHFVVQLEYGEQASNFFKWVTMTHAARYHAHYGTVGTGHLYQSRFKAFPVETETYLLRLFRYVVRNPRRANLVARAEQWRWSGLWDYAHDTNIGVPLAPWPIPRPANWLEYVDQPQTDAEVEAIRRSIQRNSPLGEDAWVKQTAKRLGLESTLRSPGRPAGQSKDQTAT